MSITTALAYASKSRGLQYLALLIALGWALGNIVWTLEKETGVHLSWLRPVIDLGVIVLILRRALAPGFGGRALFLTITGLFVIQALTRLGFTAMMEAMPESRNDLWLIRDWALGGEFCLILLSIWAYAIPKTVVRINRGRKDGPRDMPSNRSQRTRHALARRQHVEDEDPAPAAHQNGGAAVADSRPARERKPVENTLRQLFKEIGTDD